MRCCHVLYYNNNKKVGVNDKINALSGEPLTSMLDQKSM